jgi:hypothetical protein
MNIAQQLSWQLPCGCLPLAKGIKQELQTYQVLLGEANDLWTMKRRGDYKGERLVEIARSPSAANRVGNTGGSLLAARGMTTRSYHR